MMSCEKQKPEQNVQVERKSLNGKENWHLKSVVVISHRLIFSFDFQSELFANKLGSFILKN